MTTPNTTTPPRSHAYISRSNWGKTFTGIPDDSTLIAGSLQRIANVLERQTHQENASPGVNWLRLISKNLENIKKENSKTLDILIAEAAKDRKIYMQMFAALFVLMIGILVLVIVTRG